ncbi:hypothetical protein KLP40_15495 [Hymenobacter sp. NST-14]|uniref:hypothetical protein n=1 Tax=Hymenobacter piscis TaxID=2839984 RepID=UPI001C02DC25|nr:hypothetical protein [Hymenobacter piscis]MBT9394575.1 hypothetical protein [Hymenobacter piscis]
MAHRNGTLGHFLPYLLGRQLRTVFWPDGAGQMATLLLGGLSALYGVGLGYFLNHAGMMPAGTLPKMLLGVNAMLFITALLADFLPSYRPVQRPLPEPLPVSGRLNACTAFVLDLVSVRRGLLLLFLVAALLAAPAYWRPLGLSVGVWLSAAVLSFNLRLLLSMGRWRHPLLWLNLACLGAAALWLGSGLALPQPLPATALTVLAVLGPLVLGAAGLHQLGPYFTARHMPEPADTATDNRWLARLSPEWKLYLRKAWPALLMGLVFKTLILVGCGFLMRRNQDESAKTFFYLAFLPFINFTYVNNNLFGYRWAATADEVERLGLTPRLLGVYLRLVVPVLLLDCLLSAGLLLALYPARLWPLLWLLPLTAPPLLALGLWGSLFKAKPVRKNIDFNSLRNNASTLMNILTIVVAAALYFMPWWWARLALAAVVTLSAAVPVHRLLRNHGPTRRRLWRAITQA